MKLPDETGPERISPFLLHLRKALVVVFAHPPIGVNHADSGKRAGCIQHLTLTVVTDPDRVELQQLAPKVLIRRSLAVAVHVQLHQEGGS